MFLVSDCRTFEFAVCGLGSLVEFRIETMILVTTGQEDDFSNNCCTLRGSLLLSASFPPVLLGLNDWLRLAEFLQVVMYIVIRSINRECTQ